MMEKGNSEKDKLIIIDHLLEKNKPKPKASAKRTAKEIIEETKSIDIVIDEYGYGYV